MVRLKHNRTNFDGMQTDGLNSTMVRLKHYKGDTYTFTANTSQFHYGSIKTKQFKAYYAG